MHGRINSFDCILVTQELIDAARPWAENFAVLSNTVDADFSTSTALREVGGGIESFLETSDIAEMTPGDQPWGRMVYASAMSFSCQGLLPQLTVTTD